jgi:DNA-binding NtrC family response regulator
MKKSINNVIPVLQDKSITNIINYTLANNQINILELESAIKLNLISNKTLLILDNDLPNSSKNNVIDKIKSLNLKPLILLAISSNYRYFLSEPIPLAISGIIYKPFDMEEFFNIINHSINYEHKN